VFGLDVANLLNQYGLIILAIGCLLEGETVLILAGLAIHQGMLPAVESLLIAMTFGWLGDQVAFAAGRWKGDWLLGRFDFWARRKPRIDRWIHRYHALVIVMVRFAYGLRVAGPVLIGHSGLPIWKFALFNALGAAIWASLFISLGWLFGHAAEALLQRLHVIDHYLFAIAAAAVFVIGGGWWWYRRRGAAAAGRL